MSQNIPSAAGSSLPFPKWWPLVAGVLVGVVLRLMFFGGPDDPWSAMTGAFIYLTPVAVGAVTIYLAERQRRRSWGYYAVAGMLANVLFVIGTLVIMIEGLICAIVIVPLFAALGAVSGLIMGFVCRVTQWPKQMVGCVAVLPLIVGGLAPLQVLPDHVATIERSLLIAAPREAVWQQLMDVGDIRSDETADSVAQRIGVPPPVSATTSGHPGSRRVAMGKHVYFDQIEVERREHEYIRWEQRFYPDSFPPGSFDQHVVMGGKYFDISDVSYELLPEHTATRLTIRMRDRVSTRFNRYAAPVARFVLGDLEETLLEIYARRAVAAAVPSRTENARGLEQGV